MKRPIGFRFGGNDGSVRALHRAANPVLQRPVVTAPAKAPEALHRRGREAEWGAIRISWKICFLAKSTCKNVFLAKSVESD